MVSSVSWPGEVPVGSTISRAEAVRVGPAVALPAAHSELITYPRPIAAGVSWAAEGAPVALRAVSPAWS